MYDENGDVIGGGAQPESDYWDAELTTEAGRHGAHQAAGWPLCPDSWHQPGREGLEIISPSRHYRKYLKREHRTIDTKKFAD